MSARVFVFFFQTSRHVSDETIRPRLVFEFGRRVSRGQRGRRAVGNDFVRSKRSPRVVVVRVRRVNTTLPVDETDRRTTLSRVKIARRKKTDTTSLRPKTYIIHREAFQNAIIITAVAYHPYTRYRARTPVMRAIIGLRGGDNDFLCLSRRARPSLFLSHPINVFISISTSRAI